MKTPLCLCVSGLCCTVFAVASCGTSPSTGDDARDVVEQDGHAPDAGADDAAGGDGFEAGDGSADVAADAWVPPSCGSTASGPLFTPLPDPSPQLRSVSTVAGGTEGHADGLGSEAQFSQPWGLTVASNGRLYLTECRNHTIRSVDIKTWQVSTVAGKAGDKGSADGTGADARFSCPQALTELGGALYVVDSGNDMIRRVDPDTGGVETVAGSASGAGWVDGIGSATRFSRPAGITTDGVYLYVADSGNQVIRRMDPTNRQVTTLAGSVGVPGWSDGSCAEARFSHPGGLATDGPTLYISDAGNSAIRTLDIATGAVATLAGTPEAGFSFADGTGTEAHFYFPAGLATDGTSLFVSDANNEIVRQITIATVKVTTIAGKPESAGAADGIGPVARFQIPSGIVLVGGNLVVADARNHRIRLLTPSK